MTIRMDRRAVLAAGAAVTALSAAQAQSRPRGRSRAVIVNALGGL